MDDNLKHLLPKQPKTGSLRGKHKSLPFSEMPNFMVELRALTAQSAKMLEVCILTCVRTTEVVQERFQGCCSGRPLRLRPPSPFVTAIQTDWPAASASPNVNRCRALEA